MRSYAAMARRTDITLRGRYPYLNTRIFDLGHEAYAIVCDHLDQKKFKRIKEDFDKSIKPIATLIHLVDLTPSTYVQEIGIMDDDCVALNFEGFSLPRNAIIDLMLGKHPDLPLSYRSDQSVDPIRFYTTRAIDADEERRARAVCNGVMPHWSFEFPTETAPYEELSGISPDIQIRLKAASAIDIKPSIRRSISPNFIRDDEQFWFENVEGVFSGHIRPRSIYDRDEDGMACYVDATSGSQVDLRQLVLLYDTIYFTPPITDGNRHSEFWEGQHFTKDDLLKLIAAGRMKLILSQPEERVDISLLEAAHEVSPQSLIGRLRSSAYLASDLVLTAREYTLGREGVRDIVPILCDDLAGPIGMPAELLSKMLLWPVSARRLCLSSLSSRGLLGIPQFGMGGVLAEELQHILHKDLFLEAVMTTSDVHVAHAFNATYIAPLRDLEGWNVPRRIVAERLNFFRSLNGRLAASWAANERRRSENVSALVPSIALFNFEKHAPVEDFIAITSLPSTRRKGRSLVGRLSALTDEERVESIESVSADFYKFAGRRNKRQLLVDSASDIWDVATSVAGLSIPPVKSASNMLSRCLDIARRNSRLDRIFDALQGDLDQAAQQKEELDFLSRIWRVAKLKEQ